MAFFRRNPDETLRAMDVAAKFGCGEQSARQAMTVLKRDGLLVPKGHTEYGLPSDIAHERGLTCSPKHSPAM